MGSNRKSQSAQGQRKQTSLSSSAECVYFRIGFELQHRRKMEENREVRKTIHNEYATSLTFGSIRLLLSPFPYSLCDSF